MKKKQEETVSRKPKKRSRLSDFPETWYCKIYDVTPEKE